MSSCHFGPGCMSYIFDPDKCNQVSLNPKRLYTLLQPLCKWRCSTGTGWTSPCRMESSSFCLVKCAAGCILACSRPLAKVKQTWKDTVLDLIVCKSDVKLQQANLPLPPTHATGGVSWSGSHLCRRFLAHLMMGRPSQLQNDSGEPTLDETLNPKP